MRDIVVMMMYHWAAAQNFVFSPKKPISTSSIRSWLQCNRVSWNAYDRGSLSTAKYLINAAKPSDGSTNLHQRGRLNLTVEAMVVANAKGHELCTRDELDKARRRLIAYV